MPDRDEITRLRGVIAHLAGATQDLLDSLEPFVPLLEQWDDVAATPICGACFKRLSKAARTEGEV